MMATDDDILLQIEEHIASCRSLMTDTSVIAKIAEFCSNAVSSNNRILLCGNGGSAADCQHFAAELTGRFESSRGPLPAIALTTDTSAITAIANDFGYQEVFSRQVDAIGREGDVLIAISTSGASPSVIAAAKIARRKGVRVIGLTGAAESALQNECDLIFRAPTQRTARVQEVHLMVLHLVCSRIDKVVDEKGIT